MQRSTKLINTPVCQGPNDVSCIHDGLLQRDRRAKWQREQESPKVTMHKQAHMYILQVLIEIIMTMQQFLIIEWYTYSCCEDARVYINTWCHWKRSNNNSLYIHLSMRNAKCIMYLYLQVEIGLNYIVKYKTNSSDSTITLLNLLSSLLILQENNPRAFFFNSGINESKREWYNNSGKKEKKI